MGSSAGPVIGLEGETRWRTMAAESFWCVVIASEAKQSRVVGESLDCPAKAPRNDAVERLRGSQ